MAKKQITIIDEWKGVRVPQPPELKPVKVDPRTGALFILDIQNQMCCIERRPRCVATIPGIQKLLKEARNRGMTVVFTVTRQAKKDDIREEVTPLPEEPVVKGFVDKFYTTELEDILKTKDIRTVILVGTSAHGAVLHTAVGAVLRGLAVVIPVDGMSADDPYAEQYTAWHLVNCPGTRDKTTLTKIALINFENE